jgi:hypothetical protein
VAEIKKERIFEKIAIVEGKGLSHGQNLSYHPFVRL